jgi:hypothetical protein
MSTTPFDGTEKNAQSHAADFDTLYTAAFGPPPTNVNRARFQRYDKEKLDMFLIKMDESYRAPLVVFKSYAEASETFVRLNARLGTLKKFSAGMVEMGLARATIGTKRKATDDGGREPKAARDSDVPIMAVPVAGQPERTPDGREVCRRFGLGLCRRTDGTCKYYHPAKLPAPSHSKLYKAW